MKYGAILDLETTGLNAESDHIIEIGLVKFGYQENNKDMPILSTVGFLQDPGIPISEEITEITGITNQQVAGQRIDWAYVAALLQDVEIVIAHNATFDRGFIEQIPEISALDLHWGCSRSHIDWRGHGFKTEALNYLAADHGFVNPFAHRAVFDCATTYRIVSPYLHELIKRSYEKEFLLSAIGAPFAAKDALKSCGYRWNPEQRVWQKLVPEGSLEKERDFLAKDVYNGQPRHMETQV